MTLLDTHVHVWDPGVLDYPWLAGVGPLDRPFLPQDIDRPSRTVSRMIFVQSDCRPEQAIAEVRWVASLEWPELVGIVAAADLRGGRALSSQLDRLAALSRVVGIRHLLQSEPPAAFDDGELRAGLRTLAERGIPFDACVTHTQLPALIGLVTQVPELRVVLDHLGKPPVDAGIDSAAGRGWAAAIDVLAGLPQVYVKLSGLAAESRDSRSLERQGGAFLAHALRAFGAERSMIGGDWPVSARLGAAVPFADWAGQVKRVADAAGAAWEPLAHETGERFYGLAAPSE